MELLRLPINVTKTRSMRVPDEPLEFLGYRIGRNYRQETGRAYIGTRPSRSSVVSVCRRISELTHRRYGLLDQETGSEAPEPGDDRLGELLPTGTSQSGLQGGRRACDQAAAPVAVPQAQGTGREVRAVPG